MADNKGEFTIVQSCPSVPPYATTGGRGFNMETVKSMLTNMRPGHVADVGDAYLAAANALADATTQLHQCAQRLTDVWSGKDAELALGRLRQLNVTASGLHDASLKTARTYTWLGREILPWYQNEGERMGPGYVRGPGDDQDAFEMLDRMDNRILQGYIHMPPSISKDLPPPPGDSGFQGNDNVDGGRTGSPSGDPYGLPSTGTPGAPGGQPGIDPSGHGVGVPDGAGSNLSGAGGTDLAGAGGGVGADPFGAGGLGAGGLGGGGLGGGAGGLGGGPGGLGGGVLGAGAPGGIGAGRGGSAAKSGAAKSPTGKSGQKAPMGAGAGHGGGEGEEERERTTWLTEDEDVWGDDGDVAPPVIG